MDSSISHLYPAWIKRPVLANTRTPLLAHAIVHVPLLFPGDRQLKTAVLTMHWIKLSLLGVGGAALGAASCPQHAHDFVPKVVGFSLLGVVAVILVFWCVGRKTIAPADSGYNNMSSQWSVNLTAYWYIDVPLIFSYFVLTFTTFQI